MAVRSFPSSGAPRAHFAAVDLGNLCFAGSSKVTESREIWLSLFTHVPECTFHRGSDHNVDNHGNAGRSLRQCLQPNTGVAQSLVGKCELVTNTTIKSQGRLHSLQAQLVGAAARLSNATEAEVTEALQTPLETTQDFLDSLSVVIQYLRNAFGVCRLSQRLPSDVSC